MITPYLQKQNTRMRNCITAEERLTVTLRFLATGRSYECLKFSYGISPQSLGRIILPGLRRPQNDYKRALNHAGQINRH
ncbi:unnamed protein product [Spodoptera littoralis]|uniref:Uncharacterized protein n=1 Tax=Spodoptera littoralis TaxID=7109 RepID=A0A9P0N268_SPOLI|nr:unnamed protein product [Spodoptera littoralis]CAH1638886.1 unnamed protein product [Spodoptera littoralis]